MKPETNILYQKLHAFIKRYYLNRIIRGLIWTSFILIALYLILIFLEYQQYFSPKAKTLIILSAGLLTLTVFFWMVFLPTLKYFRIGPTLTYEEAAKIAGQHFSNIRDKILNALQLEKLARQHPDNVLILAGIKQKIEEIKPVPIHLAINLKENVKYLKYPSIPFFIFFVDILVFTLGSQRKHLSFYPLRQGFYTAFAFSMENHQPFAHCKKK